MTPSPLLRARPEADVAGPDYGKSTLLAAWSTKVDCETALGVGRRRETAASLGELVRLAVATRGRDEFRLARPRFLGKRRLTTALARYGVNPIVKLAFALGIMPRGYALLETIGRKTGRRRRTPVGYARERDTVWIVAEHGRQAAYVRNIEANPRVRVKLGRHWRSGTADVLSADDPRARLEQVGTSLSRAAVRLMRTELVTVRIELDG